MAVSPAVTTLCDNSNEVFLDVAKLLLTYADNILRCPNEEKYRSIRIGNPTFSAKLLPVKGAVECLFEMGFEEAETHLVFPGSASVEQLKLVRETIAAERDRRLRGGGPPVRSPSAQAAAAAESPAAAPAAAAAAAAPAPAPAPPPATPAPAAAASSQPVSPPLPQPSSLESSMSFFLTLQSNFQHVMLYENLELQQKALSHIPHQELSSAAQHKLKEAEEADPDCKLGIEEFLVLELLRWFKHDFFSWVNSLPCSRCGGSTQNGNSLSPSTDDLRWGGQRVENHYCQGCRLSTRFPRYNNPEKLLETRRGRCGEWANCFTLCCRALGLEARYIWCSTDHVWTEIYSVAQHRWLHCDSCENVCDKPLLYEVGWGKKLAYVLAFSKDQVVDVTWRYSCKHPEVLSRRTSVQEAWLLHTINGLNASEAGYVFTPTEKERSDRLLHVCYIASKDQYCRLSSSSEVVRGWDQCVWKKESVFRKVEDDWQMVYIARTEGSSMGRISWKFDFSAVEMKVKSVSIRASSQTFDTGRVCWYLQSGQTTTEFSGDGKMQSFPSLCGSSDFIVEAQLCDGSWQHSQLFRQSLKETEEPSFEILIHLEDA
uniref:Peptide-N(4)-(N-acetyl-beta-glucosaminyl)asparagine amidase n=1 Tax=Scophthalmus maximus TaxID=52904 RepID=A0A8D3DJ86_SCOMX